MNVKITVLEVRNYILLSNRCLTFFLFFFSVRGLGLVGGGILLAGAAGISGITSLLPVLGLEQ